MMNNNPYNPYNQTQVPEIKFRTNKGLMIDSGTHNYSYTRPYTAIVDGDIENKFRQVTNNGTHINRNSIAGVAASIVQPKAVPDAMVNIENGWDTSRILFMFEIEQINSPLSTVIQGYADRSDTSLQGTLDPQLKLYFNSVITLTTYEEQTPNGIIRRKKIVDNSHIFGVSHLNYLTPYEQHHGSLNSVYTQRPVDVANTLGLGALDGPYLDARSQIMEHSSLKSKRGNNSAPQYLSETIGNIAREFDANNFDGGYYESPQEVYNSAASSLSEVPINSDNVLRYISSMTNYNYTGFVTWEEMTRLFPDLDMNTDYIRRTGNVMQTNEHFISQAGQFHDWGVISYENLAATQIMQTLPTFLTQAMLLGSKGSFTNDTLGGEPIVHVDGDTFIAGFDTSRSLNVLRHRILTELMPSLTLYGERCINIAYNINLLRDAWIAVSIDGGQTYEYSSPCYADALMAPTCVTNNESLNSIANTINALATSVSNY